MASYRLHPTQQDIFLDQLVNYDNSRYNVGGYIKIMGPLDKAAFIRAANSLPQVFDALKMRFDIESGPVCFFDDSYSCFEMAEIDFSETENPMQYAKEWMQKRFNIPFELKKENLLFEQFLVTISPSVHLRYFKYHHLITDGSGVSVESQYIAKCYKAIVSDQTLNFKYPSYKDEILRASAYYGSHDYELEGAYWKDKLKGVHSNLLTPIINKSKTVNEKQGKNKNYIADIDIRVLNKLTKLANLTNVSLQHISIAAFIIYFFKVLGRKEFVFGMPIHKRSGKMKNMVGAISSDIAFKGNYNPDITVFDFLKEILFSQRQDYRYKNYLLGDLIRHFKKEASFDTLFDVMVNYVNLNFDLDFGPGLTTQSEDLSTDDERFPLQLWWRDYGPQQPLQLQVSFNTDFFTLEDIQNFVHRFFFICESFADKIDMPVSSLGIIPEAESLLLADFNKKYTNKFTLHAGSQTINLLHKLVHGQLPGISIKHGLRELSYRGLGDQLSRSSGYFVEEQGLRAGDRVVVLIDRSEWTPVMFLTILHSGLVYVPVDTAYPPDRIGYILSDVKASLVIAEPRFEAMLSVGGYRFVPLSEVLAGGSRPVSLTKGEDGPGSAAYIIYTSGSTGRPKGVEVSRGNLDHFIRHLQEYMFQGEVRMPLLASGSFDISLFQMLLPLVHGGSIIVSSQEEVQDMRSLSQLVQSSTVLDTVPGVYTQLLHYIREHREESAYGSIERLFIGGDSISDELLSGLRTVFTNAELTVTYGPTEGTIFCSTVSYGRSAQEVRGSILGRPIAGTELYVLDGNMDQVPVGIEGELCIGGSGVSSGYVNLPDQTRDRFVPNKYGGSGFLYRSGDRGRWTRDGELEFRGRVDEQVKIRGYRIEPGEIEQVLLGHDQISQAVVQAETANDGLAYLQGYYVEKGDIQLWPSISEYLGYNEIAYYAMNNDEQRAGSYRKAIAEKVGGKVVMDVGTGPDAILAQHCLSSGALRVYAIEILQDVYERARDKIASLGLSERIIVIHGDIQDIELPEAVDYCVCALVGNLGSSDGCIPIMNSARRFLKDSRNMIPSRSVSYMAAVDFLSRPLHYDLTETGAYYLNNIFEQQGSRFDVRMCVQGIGETDLLSVAGIFEDLDLEEYQPLEAESSVELEMLRTGVISGFVVWLHLHTAAGIVNDIFKSQQSFLPVYFPVFEQGLQVEAGDKLKGTVRRLSVAGSVYPDYTIEGILMRKGKADQRFEYISNRLPGKYRSSSFYKQFFSGESLTVREPLSNASLRLYLEKYLPGYMIPGKLVKLDKIPLTGNGKIDRKQLREETLRSHKERLYVAPHGENALALSKIWETLLGVSGVGMQDNFFELGGHSLLATRVVSAIRSTLSYELSIRDIFKYVTLESLSSYLTTLPQVQKGDKITVTAKPELIPLSFGQERLWFIDRLEGSVQYHIPCVLRMRGDVDLSGLEYSFQQIVNRHEVLRTRIKEIQGEAFQYVGPADSWTMEFIDLEDKHTESINETINRLISAPFDLSQDHKLRVSLMRLSGSEHMLVITLHHIASDGWSMPIMIGELLKFYASYTQGTAVDLAALPLQYIDYALWQRGHMSGSVFEKSLSYWEKKLSGVGTLQLPTDYSRPAVQSKRGSLYRFKIERSLQLKLQALSQQEGVTMFMLLLSAFKVLLYRYSGQTDICVGSAIAGRQRQELEGIIGFFVNTLALRDDLSGNPGFRELLSAVRETTMEAYEHQDIPFEKVVDAVVKERDMSKSPLFQVMFDMQVNTEIADKLENDYFSYEFLEQTVAKYDFTFTAEELQDTMSLNVEYCIDLYKKNTIEKMVEHYIEILKSIVSAPEKRIDTLNVLANSERDLLNGFSGRAYTYSEEATLKSLIEASGSKSIDLPAVISEGGIRSYGELLSISNQVGHYLYDAGLKTNSIVAICLEHGFEMMAGMLGILNAGGAYLPIEADYPDERIKYMLKDSGSVFVVSNRRHSERFSSIPGLKVLEMDGDDLAGMPSGHVPVSVKAEDLAYVIYTSGSTGYPRGVKVTHRNVVNYLNNRSTSYLEAGSEGSGSYIHLSCTFDASVTALFMPLLSGRSVVISKKMGYEAFSDPIFLKYAPYDFIKLTPGHLELLSSEISRVDTSITRLLVVGGEALYGHQVKEYVENGIEVINEYGPTEATVGCSTYRVSKLSDIKDQEGSLSIGKPIDNAYIYILDTRGEQCPVGVWGELCVGGDCVTQGYLNLSDITASKYIKNPVVGCPGELLYRTGDICRWDNNGNLFYKGREDDQVKLRGYRISVGEIESRILSMGNIKQCAVILDHQEGISQLVAYVVPGGEFDVSVLEQSLQSFLPWYMIPSRLIALDAIPLTVNGKLDRKSLPKLEAGSSAADYVGPGTVLETEIASIWQELLGVEQVSINDNFFQLGGDSIKIIVLVSKLQKLIGTEIQIYDVYQAANLRDLTRIVNEIQATSPTALYASQLHDSLAEIDIIRKEVIPLLPNPSLIEDIYPMSDVQGGMVYASLIDPVLAVYHDQMVYRIVKNPDLKIFERAFSVIVKKHSILRTSFDVDINKQSIQLVYHSVPVKVHFEDKRHLNEEAGRKYILDFLHTERLQPFSLKEPPLWRCAIIQLVNATFFIFQCHHAILDGWSVASLNTELNELYNKLIKDQNVSDDGLATSLQCNNLDFIIENMVEKKDADQYWPLEMANFKRLDIFSETNIYSRVVKKYDLDYLEKLQRKTKVDNLSLKGLFFSAYLFTLWMLTSYEDLTVGLVINTRPLKEDGEKILGCFLNTIPFRFKFDSHISTWQDYFKAVEEKMLRLKQHERTTLLEITKITDEQFTNANPFFDTLFDFLNFHVYDGLEDGLFETRQLETVRGMAVSEVATHDDFFANDSTNTYFDCIPSITGNSLLINYTLRKSLRCDKSLNQIIEYFDSVLEKYLYHYDERIKKSSVLANSERDLLNGFSGRAYTYSEEATLKSLIEASGSKSIDLPAVISEGGIRSYGELLSISNQVGHYLYDAGLKTNSIVAICLEHGFEMMAGMLGILNAGGAYLPIEADYPDERIKYMLKDSGSVFVVSNRRHSERFSSIPGLKVLEMDGDDLAGMPSGHVPVSVKAEDLAYVIYTSGSTGYPRGVKVTHRNVVNYLNNRSTSYLEAGSEGSGSYIHLSCTFDASVTALFMPLLSGRSVVISKKMGYEAFSDPIFLKYAPYDFIKLTPGHLELLSSEISRVDTSITRLLVVGGEALYGHQVKEYVENGIEVINEYGPTEATVGCSTYRVSKLSDIKDQEGSLSIGKPIDNAYIYILDTRGEQCPVGVWGELCVGGDCVTQGYLNLSDITASKYIKNPVVGCPGELLYRTGDICRWDNNGNLFYKGREDDQVKLRGYRISVGEIESRILSMGNIKQCAVILDHQEGISQLVAYVVPGGEFDVSVLEQSLQSFLPWYMIPSRLIALDAIPLTVNGKLDRKSLPKLEAGSSAADYVGPGTVLETEIASIWQELLGVEQVSINDNFFQLGGDSLLAIRLVSAIRKKMRIDISISVLFELSTITAIAEYILISQHKTLPETDEYASIKL